ncbi:MAG TPA: glycosyltransferase [Humisphaera sp.]|jgi:glycosyltransferase involved in cell wall biosynthesis|nr:glycosyltransferase [Humisphaera sp.]
MPEESSRRVDSPIRIDLHCHSNASSEPGEAVLEALGCPECYSEPRDVYAQAKRRGMNLVTITDHDSIAGVATILNRPDVLVGEELTCLFPEDGCKMHVLLWGINQKQHDDVQAIAADIYRVAQFIERHQIAHAVAHPVYRQNDRLEKWHVERLLLLFKGFECLNGAHSILHRQAFEPLLDELTQERIAELSAKHDLEALWPRPWIKSRTGGSDDHGLFNIGRTWTEFPADARTIEDVLSCLREGRCRPGGEAGSSLKLAHNFYGVGIRYFTRQMAQRPTAMTPLLSAMVGERPLRKRDVVNGVMKSSLRAIGRRIARPLGQSNRNVSGVAMLSQLFTRSAVSRVRSSRPLLAALKAGHAPLENHEAMWEMVSHLVRDTSGGIADSIGEAARGGKLAPMFDAISAIACQQFMLLPYYFALFHQNRERHLLHRVTGKGRRVQKDSLRLGVFTDTFEDMNGVSRFIRTIGSQAQSRGLSLTVHTCGNSPKIAAPYRKNFEPLASCAMPGYPQLSLSMPPLAELMEWADRQQFDAIHVHTPGPMGLCGMMVASMLRVPLLSTYHTDFPAYVFDHTADHRLTTAAESYMKWFYSQAATVFARSRGYEQSLQKMGIDAALQTLPPCVDTDTFTSNHRDPNYWSDRRIPGARHLLYCGRVSAEKNLRVLADSFRKLCTKRHDATLVIAGDGPYVPALQKQLTGLPAHFLGRLEDHQLSPLYANSDLLLFPSRTDTLGQVVLEAQACGLPVIVSNEGGPQEMMADGITGLVLPATDADAWANQINLLLADEPRRQRMSRSAPPRMSRCNAGRTFDTYWDAHVKAAQDAQDFHAALPVDPQPPKHRRDRGDELIPVGELV